MRNPKAAERVQRLLGSNMLGLRVDLGLSQQVAAERAGLHWRHWQKIERGQCNVCLASIVGIAYALEVTIPALFAPAKRGAS